MLFHFAIAKVVALNLTIVGRAITIKRKKIKKQQKYSKIKPKSDSFTSTIARDKFIIVWQYQKNTFVIIVP